MYSMFGNLLKSNKKDFISLTGIIFQFLFLSLFFQPFSYSQYYNQNLSDSAFAYYPLENGFKWVYNIRRETTIVENFYLTREVIGDTVLSDGLSYKIIKVLTENNSDTEFFRIDSSTGYVQFVSSEWPFSIIVNLFLEPGDTLHQYLGLTFDSWGIFNKWGLSEPTKNFLFTNSLNEHFYKLIKNVGLDSIVIGFDFGILTNTLKGFIVDGIVYGDTTLIVSAGNDVPLLNVFIIYQNYPNPFNPSTKINYSLTENDFVTLTIYNILGEQLTTLVSEPQMAGSHSYEFNASGLPSGIYLYKIQTSSFMAVKKMSLMK